MPSPDDGADVELTLDGAGGKRIAGQVLTAPKMDSHNAFGAPEEVRPRPFSGARMTRGKLHVTLPAKSIVVLTIG